MESLKRFGQQTPLVHRDGVVIKGNGTLEAAKRLGWATIAAIAFDGASRLAKPYKITDNRSAELSYWNNELLQEDLDTLRQENEPLDLLGWTQEEIENLEDDTPEQLPSDASKLDATGFIAPEPKDCPEKGSVIELGKHLLVIADPVKEPGVWLPYLKPEDLFCPYPGPWAANTRIAEDRRMILVQPDRMLAGYLIARFREHD
jgi:hypothetical protein